MDSDETPLTRRGFLARSTVLATTGAALAATPGCETLSPGAIATRAAARSAPEAVSPLVEDLAAPDHAISTGDAWVAFCDALKRRADPISGGDCATAASAGETHSGERHYDDVLLRDDAVRVANLRDMAQARSQGWR